MHTQTHSDMIPHIRRNTNIGRKCLHPNYIQAVVINLKDEALMFDYRVVKLCIERIYNIKTFSPIQSGCQHHL